METQDLKFDQDIDHLCINTIRTLAMDAVQKANSGHPGAPMGMAAMGYGLWQGRLKFDPAQPHWINRDRFVLSNGHASMLLYALLHLSKTQDVDANDRPTGKPAVSLDDIKAFRQLDSVCPGHPEYGRTTGVEATTGPLGQGCANSVGMAIAERWLGNYFNRPGYPIIDWRTYTSCGDGCMMEGISNEAASLAGHLGLNKLCWIYDSNRISIEGSTELAFTEDISARFLGLGWNVHRLRDANDVPALLSLLDIVSREQSRPTFIIVESHIGYGSPHKQDSAAAHGEALGEDEVRLTKKFYGWPEDAHFLVPNGVYERFAEGIGARGAAARSEWDGLFARYKIEHADLAAQLDTIKTRGLPEGWDHDIPTFPADAKGKATRDTSNTVENTIAKRVPWFLGGAADLSPSTKTLMTFDGAGNFEPGAPGGRNFHFGVREHAMGGIVNGMALTNLRPFGSTFLIFSDYMKNAIRLSALSEIPSLFIFSHDSISLGEDGPTHQPIEQLAGLRAIPDMVVLRPCDANEVSEAWRIIMNRTRHPTCLVLTRQAVPTLDRSKFAPASGLARGAYVLADLGGKPPKLILIGTGSEVALCVSAAEQLASEGTPTRIVSMPSWELFEQQDESYKQDVLPDAIPARVAVEEAAVIGWHRYVGRHGAVVGMHTFGASAPLKDIVKRFGFTPENVARVAREQIKQHSR